MDEKILAVQRIWAVQSDVADATLANETDIAIFDAQLDELEGDGE